MNTVLTALIWAGAFLIVCLLFMQKFGKSINALAEARRAGIEAESQATLALALERQNAAVLDRDTAEARAQMRNAELLLKKAEAEAAAEIGRQTLPAQVAEKEKVIAARAEGRALAAKELALRAGGEGNATSIEALMKAYEAYVDAGGEDTLDVWWGTLTLTADGRLE